MRAIEVIAARLGLGGQPRIVLFHVKEGRHHCHVVWSRIDIDRMRAIQLSHDRQKLRACARELAAEFGLELPPGLKDDVGTARFERPNQPTKAEISGIAVTERRAAVTAAYYQADSAQSFINALEAAGYILARGDKRCFVVVDIAGHVHSLSRQIEGARMRDVRAKLEGLDLSRLPPVERAKIQMAQRAQARQDVARATAEKHAAAKEAAEKLKAIQAKRRAGLDLLWQKMKIRQMHEWKVLLAHIKAEEEHYLRRQWMQRIGLAQYLKLAVHDRQDGGRDGGWRSGTGSSGAGMTGADSRAPAPLARLRWPDGGDTVNRSSTFAWHLPGWWRGTASADPGAAADSHQAMQPDPGSLRPG